MRLHNKRCTESICHFGPLTGVPASEPPTARVVNTHLGSPARPHRPGCRTPPSRERLPAGALLSPGQQEPLQIKTQPISPRTVMFKPGLPWRVPEDRSALTRQLSSTCELTLWASFRKDLPHLYPCPPSPCHPPSIAVREGDCHQTLMEQWTE